MVFEVAALMSYIDFRRLQSTISCFASMNVRVPEVEAPNVRGDFYAIGNARSGSLTLNVMHQGITSRSRR